MSKRQLNYKDCSKETKKRFGIKFLDNALKTALEADGDHVLSLEGESTLERVR